MPSFKFAYCIFHVLGGRSLSSSSCYEVLLYFKHDKNDIEKGNKREPDLSSTLICVFGEHMKVKRLI